MLAIALAATTCPARAQEDARVAAPDEETLAEARRLFAEGVTDVNAEPPRWPEAAGRFEAALALHAAPPIRYNLAVAYVELGRHREASEQIGCSRARRRRSCSS